MSETAVATAWIEHAEALADWALSRIVIRRDVYGAYKPDGGQYTAHEPITRERLIRHFRGEAITGAHSISTDNRCLCVAADIDAHEGDDKADPETNIQCANNVVETFKSLKLQPFVFDSNGKGGFHVRGFFKKTVAVEVVWWLCERIVANLAAAGFPPVETFPKQASITRDCPYGNWLRLPGRHHKRDHWMRIYDHQKGGWLDGVAAVRRLIKIAGDNPGPLIAAYDSERQTKANLDRQQPKRLRKPSTTPDVELVREALGYIPNEDAHYDDWIKIGMALCELKQDGRALFHEWSKQSRKYVQAETDAKFSSFASGNGSSSTDLVTLGTVFHLAKEGGWPGRAGKDATLVWGEANGTHQAEANGDGFHGGGDGDEVDHDAQSETEFQALRDQAAAFTLFSNLQGDTEFKARLARLEIQSPDRAAVVAAVLEETLGTKFKARKFRDGMARFRFEAKNEARGDEPSALRRGESIDDPHRLARAFLAAEFTHPEGRTLIHHREEFFLHDGTTYQLYKDVREDLTAAVKDEFDRQHIEALKAWAIKAQRGNAGEPPRLLSVTTATVNNALQALRSETALAWSEDPPCWVGDEHGEGADLNPLEIVPTQNVLVHVPSLRTLAHTPRYFSVFTLPYAWQEDAPHPVRWLRFLGELWPNDPDSIRELQKWFALMLTLDTRYQRILILIGPPRSGKGTIARILTALIGPCNVTSPSLPTLARPFGLWSLLDKSLCIFSDAHALGSTSDRAVILENLLRISGEDSVTVDRKYKEPITCKLNTRLMFIGNQPPNFRDASGALIARLAPLQLIHSWKGQEDKTLTNVLLQELPGILRHFAVPGLDMLREDGGFKTPKSSRALLDQMGELLSPVKTFAEECLEIIEDDRREIAELPLIKDIFDAFAEWCLDYRREVQGINIFGRDLRAAFPHVEDHRPEGEDLDRRRRYRGLNLNGEGKAYLKKAVDKRIWVTPGSR